MTINDWLTILAILLSPVIAVLVTLWMQFRRQARDRQLVVLITLFANRHQPVANECVQALNAIDVVFGSNARVRQLWREYYDMLGNAGLNNPNGFEQRQAKNRELIYAMAQSLGFRGAISHNDMERVYIPEAMGRDRERVDEIARELLRVLKASGGVSLSQRPPDASERRD